MVIFIIKLSGHRGYKAKEVENSKAGFLKAINENLDYIEFDVRKTKDNVPILFHDPKINRLVKNKRGEIEKFTIKQLKSFEYRDGQKILSLEEIFLLANGKIKMILDLKVQGIESEIIQLIRKYNLEKAIIIQSLHGKVINQCHKIAPDLEYAIYRGYLGMIGKLGKFVRFFYMHKILAHIFYHIKIKPYPIKYLNVDGVFMYDELISLAKNQGIKIILGARNPERYLKYLGKWKVDIINSNNPKKIKELLEEVL